MSISEIFPESKNLSQIPITKSKTFKMSNQTYENRKFQCTICLKRFKASNHLKEHLTLHSDKTNYKCEKCQMEFKAPGSWRNHMRKVHGFECPHCKKIFSTLTLLKQHRMSKHKEFRGKKLEDEIGMIEKVDDTIKQIQTQSGHKNLPPKRTTNSAPKSIIKKILAKSRLNVNSNLNNPKSGKFVCKECGFKYTLARSLRRHLNTAHKEPFKYKCTHCAYTTNRSDNFKSHNEKHAEGKSIKCTVPSCKLEFFSLKNLRVHLKKVHTDGVKISNEISIKKEKNYHFEAANLDEEESAFLEELDQKIGTENEELDGNVNESFKSFNSSFLNSTEKSSKLNSSTVELKKTNRIVKKSVQLKISTCFSLNSKKEDNNSKKVKNEKAKPAGSSVSYECCECKIDFPGNTELWEHLLAVHYHKMKNNVKK
ncbi:zinc finger and BTB domain-containing protein 11-like [Chironomus tepperi]|uniref:zinc finger and BTB domain-containing protein 11-like n=1 Tax=Chironomus tepperi TaxID=113505 RepID=UPI00391EE326